VPSDFLAKTDFLELRYGPTSTAMSVKGRMGQTNGRFQRVLRLIYHLPRAWSCRPCLRWKVVAKPDFKARCRDSTFSVISAEGRMGQSNRWFRQMHRLITHLPGHCCGCPCVPSEVMAKTNFQARCCDSTTSAILLEGRIGRAKGHFGVLLRLIRHLLGGSCGRPCLRSKL
jgi:hypothetical protein